MSGSDSFAQPPVPAFLFDLDGTLIDSVYQHVIAWREALAQADIDLSVWRIHRRIGMSGGLFVSALMRETGISLSEADVESLQRAHATEYLTLVDSVGPLPGAADLLAELTAHGVRWAIATSGRLATAKHALPLLGLPPDTPMITRDMVAHAKPDPDLFLAAAALLGRGRPGTPTSSGTASGTCSRPGGRSRSASGCCRAATAGRNWSAPARTGCTPTRPTCWPAPTSSASAACPSAASPPLARSERAGGRSGHRCHRDPADAASPAGTATAGRTLLLLSPGAGDSSDVAGPFMSLEQHERPNHVVAAHAGARPPRMGLVRTRTSPAWITQGPLSRQVRHALTDPGTDSCRLGGLHARPRCTSA